MVKKLPAMQFYPGDWHRDPGVQLLSFEDRGIWFELLLRMHDSEDYGSLVINGAAMTDEEVGRLIGFYSDEPSKFKQIVANLLSKGVASRNQNNGALCCRRMLRYKDLSSVRAQVGRLGGQASVKQRIQAKPTSSSSSSSSSSKNEDLAQQPWKVNFQKFWLAYPKKKAKGAVESWFSKFKPSDELMKVILDKLALLCQSPDWTKEQGQFIPYPAKWLKTKGWEDDLLPTTPPQKRIFIT